MSTNVDITLSFHGETFLELVQGETTVFFDPVFSAPARGRRQTTPVRSADYVFVSREGDRLEDALDALEKCDATLVADERVCAYAKAELGLKVDRLLDLAPWERASDDAFRVTAVPVTSPSMLDEGAAMMEGLTGGLLGGLLGGNLGALPRSLGRLPVVGDALGRGAGRGMRSLGTLPSLLGGQVTRGFRGRPALGWVFEMTSGQRLCFLGAGIHGATDEAELEEIAALAAIDVLLIDVAPTGVEAVVRATRAFDAATVLLYRSQDAYARGRRAQALPVNAFLEAISEDQGDEVEAIHLRTGDRFVLGPPPAEKAKEPSRAAATQTAKPS